MVQRKLHIKMETDGFTNSPREEFAMSVRHAKNYITSRFAHSDMGMSAYREKALKNRCWLEREKSDAAKDLFNANTAAKIRRRVLRLRRVCLRSIRRSFGCAFKCSRAIMNFSEVLVKEIGVAYDNPRFKPPCRWRDCHGHESDIE